MLNIWLPPNLNFTGTGDVCRSNLNLAIVGILSIYDPPKWTTYFRPWL